MSGKLIDRLLGFLEDIQIDDLEGSIRIKRYSDGRTEILLIPGGIEDQVQHVKVYEQDQLKTKD